MHDTMAFSVEGTPLGLLDMQCWARDPKTAGKREKRKKLPIEQKESYKWLKSYQATSEVQSLCPDTMLVSVGDRESDIYELFAEAAKNPKGPELLIRSDRGRNRQVEGISLWENVSKKPVAGYIEIQIPRRGKTPARIAKLEVIYSKESLKPPKDKKLIPVTLWAVYAKEVNCPEYVTSPLEWMLYTTVKVSTFEDAQERLSWYTQRWGIEVYHKTTKSVCRIKDRHLDDAEDLMSCLAIDLVVAWRIFLLTKQSRETPEIPCDAYIEEEEWKALHAYVKKAPPPKEPPSLKETVRLIASLGGFLGRKYDGDPGIITLGRGLQRLKDIVLGWRIACELYRQRDGPL